MFSSILKPLGKVVLVTCSLVLMTNIACAQRPVRILFDKTLHAPGIWKGMVTGDVTGSLTTELLSARVANHGTIHVQFKFTIAGPKPMEILINGVLNARVGRVVMNGHVAEGFLKGAKVHEAGQLENPITQRFVGLIQVMPSTAR